MVPVKEILAGDRLALARLLSQIENDTDEGQAMLSNLFPHTGGSHLIGVTGATGTGKSSLVNQLAYHYRHPPEGQNPKRVAIVAVDPSSPYSGGALLGDRVRMRDLAGDPGVFIRSMASRGSLGGLSTYTSGVVQAFEAAGFELILIETVGAGQAEVDIAKLAHTTLVVEAPGLGDEVQAIKAGLMEIADILVVNKADRPGVENTERALRNMLNLAHPMERVFRDQEALGTVSPPQAEPTEEGALWVPPVHRTIAIEGTGVAELAELIEKHRQHLQESGEWVQRERARLHAELKNRLQARLVSRWGEALEPGQYREVFSRLIDRQISPLQAVEELLNGVPSP